MALDRLPDFSFKGGIDPAIIQAYQQKAAQEQQMRMQGEQLKQQKINQVSQVFQAGAGLVNQLQQHNQQQQMKLAQQALSGLLTSPADKQTPEYQAELENMLMKVDPQQYQQQKLKSVFEQMKPPTAAQSKMIQKPVIIDEEPVLVNVDPQGNMFFRNGQPVPVDADVKPHSPSFYADVKLSDRDRNDKTLITQAQAALDGRGLPGGMAALRTPRGQKIAALAYELDPSWDMQVFEQRQNIRRDFTRGDSKKAGDALDTMLFHTRDVLKAFDKLDNTKIRGYNTVANMLKRELKGNPELASVNALRRAIINEVVKVSKGSGVVTVDEQQIMNKITDPMTAPAEFKAAVGSFVKLAGGRFQTLQSNWDQHMEGYKPPYPIMNENSKKILTQYGYDPKTMESLEPEAPQASGPYQDPDKERRYQQWKARQGR